MRCRGVLTGAIAALALAAAAGNAIARCHDPKGWGQVRRTLDAVAENEPLGAIAIGQYFKHSKPKQFYVVRESGCYETDTYRVKDGNMLRLWLNNQGEWDDGVAGSFVAIHVVSISDPGDRPEARIYRNGNDDSRKVRWAPTPRPSGPVAMANADRVVRNAEAFFRAPDRAAADAVQPGFLAYGIIGGVDLTQEAADLYTYLAPEPEASVGNGAAPTPRPQEAGTSSSYQIVRRFIALAFDGRPPGQSGGKLVPFNVSAAATCLEIRIASPHEIFGRRFILSLTDENVACETLLDTR
jgi:hypothetical protein